MCPVCAANLRCLRPEPLGGSGLISAMTEACKRIKTYKPTMKLAERKLEPEIVSKTEWLVARRDLLSRERQINNQRDVLTGTLPIVDG